MNTPPFLRVELRGESAVGEDHIILTRETLEGTRVKIESPSRVIYCDAKDVRVALQTITQPETEKLEGN